MQQFRDLLEASYDISMVVDLAKVKLAKLGYKMTSRGDKYSISTKDNKQVSMTIGSRDEWDKFIGKEIRVGNYPGWTTITGGSGNFEEPYWFSFKKRFHWK
jgi:hypothetical protein